MSRKLVLLFLEGPTDQKVFNNVADEMSSEVLIFIVEPYKGDAFQINQPHSALDKITSRITEVLDKLHLTVDDLKSVYYLMDVDGAFIPDSDIIINPQVATEDDFQYDPNNSRVNTVSETQQTHLKSRWSHKAQQIESALANNDVVIDDIHIPLHLFYNSLTLEHVLHGNPIRGSQASSRKSRLGTSFQRKLKNRVDDNETSYFTELKNFFKSLQHGETAAESWEYVKLNPWERSSSVYLMLDMLKDEQ